MYADDTNSFIGDVREIESTRWYVGMVSAIRPRIWGEKCKGLWIKMVKTGQFTTKCKGNKVIALKRQKSLWWDST